MQHVRIVTDSAAELENDVVEALEITVVPWRVRQGTESFDDDPSLRRPEFYRDAVRKKTLPVVTSPDESQMVAVYEGLAEETAEIVSIHTSAQLGGAATAASRARTRFVGQCRIQVIDSEFVSRPMGHLVIAAARAAAQGASGDAVARRVHGMMPHVYCAFSPEPTEYLMRHKLIAEEPISPDDSSVFQPLLLLEGGEFVQQQRSRRRGTLVERLVEFTREFEYLTHISLVHAGLAPDFVELRTMLDDALQGQSWEEHIYGPVLASFLGPAALGVAMLEQPT